MSRIVYAARRHKRCRDRPSPRAAARDDEVTLGKYDALEAHLRRQKAATYEMTFRDIERTLGALLPKGARRAEWWANDETEDSRRVQCKAWLGARYRAALLRDDERVRFTRVEP